jgi:predicted Zn finger-like uncharacterized protein
MKVNCPQCQKVFDIPDHYIGKTVKCLNCGHSFVASSKNTIEMNMDSSVVLIEKTSKKFKGRQLIGITLIIVSIFFVAIGISFEKIAASIIGGLFFLAGLITYVVARFQAWWHHG